LNTLGPGLPSGHQLNQIVMVAPDIDRETFVHLAIRVKPYSNQMTLYVSSSDDAMSAARRISGGISRAGDVPQAGPLIVPGSYTIQADSAAPSSYEAFGERMLHDVGLLLRGGEQPPEVRHPMLQRIRTPQGEYWRFPDARPPATEGQFGAMPVFFGTDRKLVQ